MRRTFITGVGLRSDFASTNSPGLADDPANGRLASSCHEAGEQSAPPLEAPVRAAVQREDRAVLTDGSILALNATWDAFVQAEAQAQYSDEDREGFSIFTASDNDREELYRALINATSETGEQVEPTSAQDVRDFRKAVHPLRIFRKLPTNTEYHLSKVFRLRGGGYPLRRMSLGGMALLEESCTLLSSGHVGKSLLCAHGNMRAKGIAIVFEKMGLLATEGTAGVVPSRAAASLILEAEGSSDIDRRPKLAEVLHVKTRYSSSVFATTEDWLALYEESFSQFRGQKPTVILYDNGAPSLGEQEEVAVRKFFGDVPTIRYKPVVGYSGVPNNLVDAILALKDSRIADGAIAILNGVGASSGLGAAVIRKGDPRQGGMVQ